MDTIFWVLKVNCCFQRLWANVRLALAVNLKHIRLQKLDDIAVNTYQIFVTLHFATDTRTHIHAHHCTRARISTCKHTDELWWNLFRKIRGGKCSSSGVMTSFRTFYYPFNIYYWRNPLITEPNDTKALENIANCNKSTQHGSRESASNWEEVMRCMLIQHAN